MRMSEKNENIFKALAAFRKNLKQPLKDADNPFFRSKYVPLENIVEVIDKAIEGTGLSYTQEATSEGQYVSVATYIFHESGEFINFDKLSLPATKADAQGFGSAVTYAKRYSLAAVFGVTSDEDDDGNKASGENAPKLASEVQIKAATNLVKKLAEKNGMSTNQAEQVMLDYLKIEHPISQATNEEMGLILNYLNSKKG